MLHNICPYFLILLTNCFVFLLKKIYILLFYCVLCIFRRSYTTYFLLIPRPSTVTDVNDPHTIMHKISVSSACFKNL